MGVANGEGNGNAGCPEGFVRISAGVVRRRGNGDATSREAAIVREGAVSSVVSRAGGPHPVSIWSRAGDAILANAIEKGLEVAIVRGGKVLRGVPSRYASTHSGYRLGLVYFGGYINGNRRLTGRTADILSTDFVILSSDYPDTEVEEATRETGSDVEQICEQSTEVSAAYAYDRNFAIGRFLASVEAMDDRKMKGRMGHIQEIRMGDTLAILDYVKLDAALAKFLRIFLNYGLRKVYDFQAAVDEFCEAKGLQKKNPERDPGPGQYSAFAAISFANALLRNCSPSPETKKRLITYMDHAATVQIGMTGGERCAFLPDLKEGDDSSRDELFALHSKAKGVVKQAGGRGSQLLFEALLFQYYGVPLDNLVSFGTKDVLKAVEMLNKRISGSGLVVYINNGLAVLGEVGKPATLLADCGDAKAYTERFAGQVVGTLDDAREAYGRSTERMNKVHHRRSENAVKEMVHAAIRDFMKVMSPTSRSEEDVAQLVAAFANDDGTSSGSADWIETVSEITPGLRRLHSQAARIARNRIVRSDIGQYVNYLNGQILMLALIHQYNGVKAIDLENLPFKFNPDTCLTDVIDKTNGAIKRYGWKIYVRGGVVLLGPDLESEDGAGKRVQICGRKLIKEDCAAFDRMPIRTLLRAGGKKAKDESTDDGDGVDIDEVTSDVAEAAQAAVEGI